MEGRTHRQEIMFQILDWSPGVGVKNKNESNEESYAAMKGFLNMLHGEYGWTSLGGLLGSMSDGGGAPADPAIPKDWVRFLKSVSENNSNVFNNRAKIYSAMVIFLDRMFFEENCEDLEHLIKVIETAACDARFKLIWDEAVQAKFDGEELART